MRKCAKTMNFLAPSHLDYSAYCTARKREGIIGNYSLAAAMACLQEAREWKSSGNFEIVSADTLVKNEAGDCRFVEKNRLSLKHAIHQYSFAILELDGIGHVIACGYSKDGVIVCSPGDPSVGTGGKIVLKWNEFDSHFIGGWCVA